MDPHESDLEADMSNNEEDLSETELQDEDSGEDVLRIPVEAQNTPEPDVLAKLKQPEQVGHNNRPSPQRNMNTSNGNPLAAVSGGHPPGLMPSLPFPLPAPFPFSHPAFLPQLANPGAPPASTTPAPMPNNNVHSSGSSHSSESSNGSQQTWSFEEQFKQKLNQSLEAPLYPTHAANSKLYEINDDPKRKEFLDDLFSFMQKKGSPINRLPIMAKSVLDLYELYNLVIARGGLVDVINKKLWQEIIKGLHLPSSITSAAFTLRTQYMKYLYPFECERKKLSTPVELQCAIDGNRREGRRGSYGPSPYTDLVQRTPGLATTLASQQMSPLSLVTSGRPMMNGTGGSGNAHVASAAAAAAVAAAAAAAQHPSHHQLHPTALQNMHGFHPSQPQPAIASTGPTMPMVGSQDIDSSRMVDYIRFINNHLRINGTLSPPAGQPQPILRQGSSSPPSTSVSPNHQETYNELARMGLWNLYQNNFAVASSNASIVGPPPNMITPPSPLPSTPVEPQREALDLGVRDSPAITPSTPLSRVAKVKREMLEENDHSPAPKKIHIDEDEDEERDVATTTSLRIGAGTKNTHIKISNQGEGSQENSLTVSMELNGIVYEGVLFAQNAKTHRST